jgi:hypothetical protein
MSYTEEIDLFFCFPGRTYYSQAMVSWANTVEYLIKNRISYRFNFGYTPLVHHTRNILVASNPGMQYESIPTKPFDGKYKPKKVIMIDDDIVWTVEDIKKIIESDKDIIGGFYWSEIENKVVAEFIDNPRNKIEAYELDKYDEPIELNQCGFGFVAINFEVFEKMQFPWFELFYVKDTRTNEFFPVGEDVYFSIKARELGYKTYGDPSIKLKHIKKMAFEIPTNKK